MTTRTRPTVRLGLEHLEDRTTPTTFTVSNANDSGPGSLRSEIALATADGQQDTIDFAPSLAGSTIDLSTVGNTSVGPSAFLVSTAITIEGTGQTIARSAGAAEPEPAAAWSELGGGLFEANAV